MNNVDKQYDAAFRRVRAYLVMSGFFPVARIVFKYGESDSQRLTVFMQVTAFGGPPELLSAYAGGAGYDKRSAALSILARRANKPEFQGDIKHLFDALEDIGNASCWYESLKRAGFVVHQVV